MKRFLQAILPLVLFVSCTDTSTPPTPPKTVTTTHMIRDVDFIADTYFLIDNPGTSFSPAQLKTGVEVYRTILPQDHIVDPSMRFPGWVIPDSAEGDSIREVGSAINAGEWPPNALLQEFTRLTAGTDYDLIVDSDKYSGERYIVGIALRQSIPPTALRSIGVRYVTTTNDTVGGSYTSLRIHASYPHVPNSVVDTLMLKMIKAPDPRPAGTFGSTWRLMMRNIYDTGFRNIEAGSIHIAIEDNLNVTRLNPSTPEGSAVHYLQIFGLDQLDNVTEHAPADGLVDPLWVDLTHGLLSFPDLRPFAPDPANVDDWTKGQFAFTGPYQAQYDKSERIYDRLLNPTQLQDVHQYLIRVAVTTPAP